MISVIMPVYNAENFLTESIESILNQTECNFEFIIVNDGSTDHSEEIILSFNDPRIIYIKKENGGEGSARNVGIDASKGDYIAWQDADDVSLPNRLEFLKSQFFSNKIGIVHTDMLLIDENNTPIHYYHSSNMNKKRMLRYFLKIGTPFMNPSSMIRKELFKNFTYQTYKIGADSDFIFKRALEWETIHIPEPLLLYRRHSNNITNTKDYKTLFEHVQAFLSSHSIEELVPEVNWGVGAHSQNEAIARSICSLFLFRRGMSQDGKEWYEEAVKLASEEPEVVKFVNAIGNIIVGDYQKGLAELLRIREKGHIVNNYIGEIYGLLGDSDKAYKYFIKAIQQNPHYSEPHDNLKGIGMIKGYHIVDTNYYKFSKR